MEKNSVKNTVVLKNIPSNLIEEAIIILKKNIKLKDKEEKNTGKSKDYIAKEAEMIINQYITKEENEQKNQAESKKIIKKYNKMKKWLYVLTGIIIIETVMLLV